LALAATSKEKNAQHKTVNPPPLQLSMQGW
jgi:hypothetical protein